MRSERHHLKHAWFSFGQGPGFINDERPDSPQDFEGFGVLEKHAHVRTTPDRDIIHLGVARPSAHGQAMMSTATALTSAYVKAGCGPMRSQSKNVIAATKTTAGTNQAATTSAKR